MLITSTLKDIHYKSLGNSNFKTTLEALWGELKPLDDLPNHKGHVLDPYNPDDSKKQPANDFERGTLAHFLEAARKEEAAGQTGTLHDKTHTFADGTPTWDEHITPDKKEYQYIQGVFLTPRWPMECDREE